MIGKLFMLVIVALGVGLAIPSTRPRILNPVLNRINNEIVPRRLEAIAAQLDMLTRRGEDLPTGNWERWIGSQTMQSPIDPWGNVYYLDRTRDSYTVGSRGADREKGTADDLTVRRTFTPRRGR